MGYRHRWGRPLAIEQGTYDAIRDDFARLIPALKREGVHLRDGCGEGPPVLTKDEILFNGRPQCRCRPKLAPGLEYRPDDGSLLGQWPGESPRHVEHWSGYDLDFGARGCGKAGGMLESCAFPRVIDMVTPNGSVLDECKTNRRCYDLAVLCLLVVAKRHLGDLLMVYSDARERWWEEPCALCQGVLGYGEGMRVGEPWDESQYAR